MTVIRDLKDELVTVRFDDGTIVRNKSYKDFRERVT